MLDWFSPNQQEWLVLVLVPILSGVCAWLAFWAAHKLTFYPVKFSGVSRLLGWQGTLHKHSGSLLEQIQKDILSPSVTLPQIYELVGPEKITQQIVNAIRPQLDGLIDEVMQTNHTVLWENLPINLKNRFYARTHKMLPRIIDDIVEEIGDNADRLISLKSVMTRALNDSPEAFNTLYLGASDTVQKRSKWGLVALTTMSNIATSMCWYIWQQPWIIPLGLTTTALAICWLGQYLLHGEIESNSSAHQLQLSKQFYEQLCVSLLSPQALTKELLLGEKSKHTKLIIRKHVNSLLENLSIRTFAQLTVGPSGYVDIKQTLADKIAEIYLEPFSDTRFNQQRARIISEHLINQHIAHPLRLTASILRPVFSELEWPLITLNTAIALVSGLGWMLFLLY